MLDQAAQLRTQMEMLFLNTEENTTSEKTSFKPVKVVAVASGKGGVGKSNFCVNFGLALAEQGVRVLILDADVGFANVEVLLNLSPSHSLLDVLEGRHLTDIVEHSPYGLSFISGGNGLFDHMLMSSEDYGRLIWELGKLSDMYDVVLMDCAAGVNEVSLRLVEASDQLVLVTTPEPTAMADAYALLKLLVRRLVTPSPQIVVNRAQNFTEAKQSVERLSRVSSRFLDVQLDTLGFILEDPSVSQAVMRQVPVLHYAVKSKASSCYRQLASNFLHRDVQTPSLGVPGFFDRLLKGRLLGGGRDRGHGA